MIVGISSLVLTVLGGICGGPIISRFKLQLRGLSITLACLTGLAVTSTASNWLIYCPSLHLKEMAGYVHKVSLKV